MIGAVAGIGDTVGFKMQHIVARTAIDQVRAQPTGQRIVAIAAKQAVITGPADKNIIAIRPGQRVVSGPADDTFNVTQAVIALCALRRTISKVNHNRCVAVAVIGHIGARTTGQRIVSGTGIQGIVTIAAQNGVITRPAKQHIIPGTARNDIVLCVAGYGVVKVGTFNIFKPGKNIVACCTARCACAQININAAICIFIRQAIVANAADQGVITACTQNGIVARTAIQDINVVIANQNVIASATGGVFNAVKHVIARGPGGCASPKVNRNTGTGIAIIGGIIAIAAAQGVVARTANQGVVPGTGIDHVVAVFTIDNIIAIQRIDFIIKLAAIQNIVVFRAFDGDITIEISRPKVVDVNAFQRQAFARGQ